MSEKRYEHVDVFSSIERLCMAEHQKRKGNHNKVSQDVEDDKKVLENWQKQLPEPLNTVSLYTSNCNYHEEAEN